MNYSIKSNMIGGVATKIMITFVAIAVLGGSVYGTYVWQHQKIHTLDQQVSSLSAKLDAARKPQKSPSYESDYTSKKGVDIKVYVPVSKSSLISPTVIMGQVPGNWSFEASFPILLLDSNGNTVARANAQLLGDWMTDKTAPFTAKLSFTDAPRGEGTLLLQKDNPSGLEANDDSVAILVNFD